MWFNAFVQLKKATRARDKHTWYLGLKDSQETKEETGQETEEKWEKNCVVNILAITSKCDWILFIQFKNQYSHIYRKKTVLYYTISFLNYDSCTLKSSWNNYD